MAVAERERLSIERSAKRLESSYLKESRRKIYIALENANFVWDEDEVRQFIQMWKNNFPLEKMAKHFGRPEYECGLLVMDLNLKNIIGPRKQGLWGMGRDEE